MFRASEATDPRDKVYAFLGLIENEATQKAAQIVPDYSRSVESVYIDATKLIMKSKGFNLEVFSQREDDPMAAMGPMWTAAGLKAPTNDIRYLPSNCVELHGVRVDEASLWKGPLLRDVFAAGPKVGSKKTCELVYVSATDVLELMASVPEFSTIQPPTSSPSLADEFYERNGGPTVLRPLNIVAVQEQVSHYQSKGEVF
ncbi:heterokaryon incompatibility protein [Fusarium bulbicola]|nr:heterokaryon incompatibility protein [Fusarium bulbicola]